MPEFKIAKHEGRALFTITKQCTARCKHCFKSCGPDRSAQHMDLQSALGWIDEIKKFRYIKHIIFGGGEPFLHYHDLIPMVRKVKEMNLHPHVLTNGFWAKDPETADKLLAPLAAAGLEVLHLSVDDFHQEFVPLDCVLNASRAAIFAGIDAGSMSIYLSDSTENYKYLGFISHTCKAQLEYGFQNSFVGLGRSHKVGRFIGSLNVEMAPCDRSLLNFPARFKPIALRELLKQCCPAGNLIEPNIDPDGLVTYCVDRDSEQFDPQSKLILGNAHEEHLSDILMRANASKLYKILGTPGGFGVLVKKIIDHGLQDRLREAYYDRCELCMHLLGDEKMREILVAI